MRSRTPLRLTAVSAALLAATAAGIVPASAVSGGTGTDAYGFAARLTAEGRACSGALVAPGWLLTAASCFPENPQGGVPAKATTALVGRPGRTAKVTDVVVRADRGVALARLDTTFTDVPAVALPATSLVVGEPLRLIGYGRTSTEWVPDQPHSAVFTSAAGTTGTLTLTGANGADACKGDAGGPVIREIGGVTELFAVASTSWQHGCFGETETRQGTTAQRIDDLSRWIRGQVLAPTARGGNHSVTVSWSPLRLEDQATYTVYGSTDPQVPTDAAHLLGETTATSYVHTSLPAKQTWYYRVTARPSRGSSSEPSATVSATTTARSAGDFTGDGKDDIATFTRGTAGDAFAAASDGTRFVGTTQQWNDNLAFDTEIPLSGDFNGDGKDDIATFTRGTAGDAFAAASDGTRFVGTTQQWNDNLAFDTEIPLSGDFNGDGKVDAIVFKRGTSGDVVVALSDGTKFGTPALWHDYFGIQAEVPAVGDFNGDGKDDIALFVRGTAGDVYVALSDGTKFGTSALWHGDFGFNDEQPAVGDFNGDGKDDIAVFARGTSGDVFAALSDGTKFTGTSVKWHDYFGIQNEVPAVGDFNGDGKDDIAVFVRGTAGDVYVALSDGTKFGTSALWHDYFGIQAEVPAVGDFNGDGKDDIALFVRGTAADVFVALSDGTKFGTSAKWHDNFAYNSEVPVPRAITVL
ncbi:FG-GAP-like repeat-containing protein [Amycolatopsis sp. DG1A-15b]|uniref:FG-GAP-like repeat-containing protein n=1 Tax=Amycolatopsis sp. DG1A-15b TaxID=3052846 RepID=UPI00255BB1C8|nr:FG-GAP-like repeat-containing protein [Amycolatopsis sp. DG1A-15b]WIX88951.1 FG-GAP-like repeat-containing protein [Amycolatopsis sp. DG1A-15b]